jgi:hypothetical protein
MAAFGAGEILLTSMDRDGTKAGFDLELTRAVSDAVPVPVIASGGVGNLQHLGMEHLQALAKIKMNHVPYKGAAPAFIDTLSGRIDLQFANIVGVLPHVENKRVRAIAISASRGASVLPDVPGVSATLPAFDLDGWMGLFVRAGTPQDIIAKLHRDLATAVQSPDYRERFAKRGADVVVGGPEGLARLPGAGAAADRGDLHERRAEHPHAGAAGLPAPPPPAPMSVDGGAAATSAAAAAPSDDVGSSGDGGSGGGSGASGGDGHSPEDSIEVD